MLDGVAPSCGEAAARWLADFEKALADGEHSALAALFRPDAHWRDLLALKWDIETVSGREAILSRLPDAAAGVEPSGFEIDPDRTPPRQVIRAGSDCIEAIFRFATAVGRGSGVLRLTADKNGTQKAWTLLTALDEITAHTERIGDARPSGTIYSRDFSGPNWLDRRNDARAYADRDPDILVVGAGQAGLSVGARLAQLGLDTLIVDSETRLGDNWRLRYHALTLHNQVHVNHMPYMPFPPNWPRYIPKDKIANWFEAYAESMELNVWTETGFETASYDDGADKWTAVLKRADGTVREMKPRHIVMATGVSAVPIRPKLPGLDNFNGTVLHSGEYTEATQWSGKKAIVVGTGNSGHDIAQDLHSHGCEVTMIQRGSTMIVNVEPSAQLPYALYDEGPSTEDCDLIVASVPLALQKRAHQLITGKAKELDSELLDGLQRIGFKLDFGDDDTGWQFKYLKHGGGYYFNVGCSDLLAEGQIGLAQNDDVARFTATGVELKTGELLPADLVVLATGFEGQAEMTRRLLGDEIADRVGGVWGFDPELQELRSMWTRTGQPGLWYIAGSFAQCRIYSKYLALQIKACEEGLMSRERSASG